MSANMKASVLLTLKDELSGKAKAAAKGLDDLGKSASRLKGAGAGALDKAAADAAKLGAAADKAAASLNHVGAARVANSGLAQATRDANALAAAADKAAAATGRAAAATGRRQFTAGDWASQRAAWRAENRLHDREVAKGAKEPPGGGNMLAVGGSKLMNAFFGVQLAGMAAHAVDGVASRVGDVEGMREKLKWSMGGDKAAADAAYARAMELSGKYRNTSVLENLHIIDDLRANLPEDMGHILEGIADPFVKMHGFFKAWEGGKHKGTAEHALKEIGAAIRAGELTANVTGEQLADYVQSIATARAVMGDKFKVSDYLTMVRQASIDLAGASKTFQMVDAPVLAQALGAPRAGTALQSIGQRLVAGNRIQNQVAEGWRRLGLVDEGVLGAGDFNKNGEIIGSHLKGKKWLKDADMLGRRPTDFVMERLMPALERDGFKALKGEEMSKAWKARDADKLTALMAEFTKGEGNLAELRRRIGPLASDPVLAKALETLFERSASIARDDLRIGAVPKNLENFESYDKAKQEVAAQADRLLQAATGEGFMGNVNKALTGLSGMLGRAADAIGAWLNPEHELSKWIGDYFGQGNDWNTKIKAQLPEWMGGFAPMVVPDQATGKEMLEWGLKGLGSAEPPGYDLGEALREKLRRMTGTGLGGDWTTMPPGPALGFGIGAAGYGPEMGAAAQAGRMAEAEGIAGGPAPATAGAEAAPSMMGTATAPITIQAQGPTVTFNQAPPSISISVVVNATTNAAPGEIGAAVAGQVRGALGGALHDGGQ